MADVESVKRGWFDLPGRPGDRSLDMQLLGLDPLLEHCSGTTILDIGCAEGVLDLELADRGAIVHGVEIVKEHVEIARKLAASYTTAVFECGDANTYEPHREYDTVLLLAILHKLKDPSRACARFAKVAKDLVVMRLPPEHAPGIVDARSGNKKHDMQAVMTWYGFQLERVTRGSFSEWCGWFRRIRVL